MARTKASFTSMIRPSSRPVIDRIVGLSSNAARTFAPTPSSVIADRVYCYTTARQAIAVPGLEEINAEAPHPRARRARRDRPRRRAAGARTDHDADDVVVGIAAASPPPGR